MPDFAEAKRKTEAFDKQHGAYESDATTLFFHDGAERSRDPLGVMIVYSGATHESEWKLHSNICQYHKLKLERLIRAYDDLNTRLAHSRHVQNEAEALQELESRAQAVRAQKQALAEAHRIRSEETAWGKRQAELRAERAEQDARIRDFQERRKAIRV